MGRTIIAIDRWWRRIGIGRNGIAISRIWISGIAIVAISPVAISPVAVAPVAIGVPRSESISRDRPDYSPDNDAGRNIAVIVMVVAAVMISIGKRGSRSKS
jgi:hypothetical protein